MTAQNFDAIATWLKEQAEAIAFGEVGVRLVIHQGRARIEKTVLIREQAVD